MFPGEMSRCTIPNGCPSLSRLVVSELQGLEGFVSDVVRETGIQRLLAVVVSAGHNAGQIATNDVLLGHEVFGTDPPEVENRHDVRMHEAGLHACLVDELCHGLLVA